MERGSGKPVSVRIREDELEKIQEAATREGKNMSDFLRDAAYAAATARNEPVRRRRPSRRRRYIPAMNPGAISAFGRETPEANQPRRSWGMGRLAAVVGIGLVLATAGGTAALLMQPLWHRAA